MDDKEMAFQQGVIPSLPKRAHKKHSLCEHSLLENNYSLLPSISFQL